MTIKIKKLCYTATTISLILFLLLLITSCASDTDINKENFTKAINAHLHKQKLCFKDKVFKFPKVVSEKDKLGKDLLNKYDALHAAGLVSRKKTVKKIDHSDLSMTMEKAVRYELTTRGFKYAKTIREKNKKKYLQFCFARSHAASIKEFTPPKKAKGKTTTTVTFQYSLTKVAKWARKKKLLDTFPQVKQEIDTLTNPIEKKATLLLTKDKWVYKKN